VLSLITVVRVTIWCTVEVEFVDWIRWFLLPPLTNIANSCITHCFRYIQTDCFLFWFKLFIFFCLSVIIFILKFCLKCVYFRHLIMLYLNCLQFSFFNSVCIMLVMTSGLWLKCAENLYRNHVYCKNVQSWSIWLPYVHNLYIFKVSGSLERSVCKIMLH